MNVSWEFAVTGTVEMFMAVIRVVVMLGGNRFLLILGRTLLAVLLVKILMSARSVCMTDNFAFLIKFATALF